MEGLTIIIWSDDLCLKLAYAIKISKYKSFFG